MVPGVIGYIPEYRGVTGTPRRLLGLMGPIGGRGEAARAGPRAPPPSPNRTRRGGRRPPSFSLSSFPLPNPFQLGVLPCSRTRKQGRGAAPPPSPIRTRGEGGAAAPWPFLLFPLKPIKAHCFSGNPPVLRFYPKLPWNTSGVRI